MADGLFWGWGFDRCCAAFWRACRIRRICTFGWTKDRVSDWTTGPPYSQAGMNTWDQQYWDKISNWMAINVEGIWLYKMSLFGERCHIMIRVSRLKWQDLDRFGSYTIWKRCHFAVKNLNFLIIFWLWGFLETLKKEATLKNNGAKLWFSFHQKKSKRPYPTYSITLCPGQHRWPAESREKKTPD